MASQDELRQQLLELVYGLLADDEAAQLRTRIDSEPETAALYADAQRKSDLLAEASRMHEPKIALEKKPLAGLALHALSPEEEPLLRSPEPSPLARTLRWAVGLAAAVLILVTAGGYWRHQAGLADIASNHLRLVVTGPAKLEAGVDNQFSVSTTSAVGAPQAVEVEYAVYSQDGQALLKEKENTDVDGRLAVTIPASLELASAARFEVLAVHHDSLQRMQTTLPVERERFVTQLSLDKPLYQPGETVYYRSLTLSRFGLHAPDDMMLQFEIHDPSGAAVPGSESNGFMQHGVGNGAFTVSEQLAGGEYTLVARSPDNIFPEEKRPFFIRQYRLPRLKKDLELTRDSYTPGDKVVADFSAQRSEGGPVAGASLRVVATVDGNVVYQAAPKATSSGTYQVEFTLPKEIDKGDGQLVVVVDDGGTRETIAKTIPINLGKVDVNFYPEGGSLVAGLENRVYFMGRDPLAKPVHIEGQVVDSRGREVAKVETKYKGLGSFTIKPQAGESYSIKIAKPVGLKSEPKLPELDKEQQFVLSTGDGVFESTGPIGLKIRSEKENQPLVVAAYCRGVQVGQQALTTKKGTNEVEVPVVAEASGVLRVTVFDYSAQPPRPVAERLVYRRPERKLHVRVGDHSERYSPGEAVQVSLMVTNEKGEPTPAVLGVSVVDDSLLKLADDDTPQMTTHFYLTTEVEKPEDLEKSDFYLSDDAKAPVALDMLLGTQGWRRFVEKTIDELQKEGREDEQITRLAALGGVQTPPAMFDNLAQVESEYRADLDEYQTEQRDALALLGRISFFGALAIVCGVALLALARWAASVQFLAPTLGAAAACLLIGLAWMNTESQQDRQVAMTPFTDFSVPPPPPSATAAPDMAFFAAREAAGADKLGLKEFEKAAAAVPAAAAPVAEQLGEAKGKNLDQFGMMQQNRAMLGGGAAAGMGGRGLAMRKAGEERQGMLKQEALAKKEFVADAKARRKLQNANGRFENFRDGKDEAGERDARRDLRFVVRQYAHEHIAGEPGVRQDFSEMLYWHPLLVADAQGRATLKFDLADSVTAFRVLADAQANDLEGTLGRIGSGSGTIISRIPFSLEPKLPLEVTSGDRIDLPVAVNNDSLKELPVALSLAILPSNAQKTSPPVETNKEARRTDSTGELLKLDSDAQRQLTLKSEQRAREYFPLTVVGQKGKVDLEVRGAAGMLADAKRQSLTVVPPGFPMAESYAGKLEGEQQVTIRLPADWVPGSLEVSLAAFPSTLADLQKGMDSILQEPYGCFEQASTSNYPNVLTLQYLEEHKVANPDLTRRAKDLLKNGYAKLTGYECPKKGYEWFGGDPGHEALTAYGLMEFRDMAQVHEVDPAMIQRTADWLLARRDGKGSFERNPRALDSFGGAPQHITDAYIVWALSESGQTGIEKELEHVAELGRKSEDPYLIALAAAAATTGKQEAATELLEKLTKAQAADGHLDGKEGSITRSGGLSLTVETTALAALALLKEPKYLAQANKAIEWITKSRQGAGGFGSTQATILALKALVAHAQANHKTITGGDLVVKRNNEEIGRQPFGAGHENTIAIEGIAAKLEPGENQLTISLSGDNQMPYALDVSYRSRTPASHPDCPVRLSTRLASDRVKAGDTVSLKAELVNQTEKGQPMTIAILGLPAGLQPRSDQLEDLKKAGTIDYYETRAREVICYWRSVAPSKKIEWKLDLVAEWPGQYTGPASRAYLYYTAEQKQWVEPLAVEVTRE